MTGITLQKVTPFQSEPAVAVIHTAVAHRATVLVQGVWDSSTEEKPREWSFWV